MGFISLSPGRIRSSEGRNVDVDADNAGDIQVYSLYRNDNKININDR